MLWLPQWKYLDTVKILVPERSIILSSLNYCIIQTITFHPLTSYCLVLYDLKIETLVKSEEKEAVTWVSGFHMVVHRATGITVESSCYFSCIKASQESELIAEDIFDHLNQL